MAVRSSLCQGRELDFARNSRSSGHARQDTGNSSRRCFGLVDTQPISGLDGARAGAANARVHAPAAGALRRWRAGRFIAGLTVRLVM